MAPDRRLAQPGDPDLDCHLTGLRLTTVNLTDATERDVEGMLIFDTTGASGFWIDSATAEPFRPDVVTRLDYTFGLTLASDRKDLAEIVAARLLAWAETGVPLEMACAPGKWTLLCSPSDVVPLPRTTMPAMKEAVDG